MAILSGRESSPQTTRPSLVLLAQMVSAALDNAQLHRTTESSEARWRVLVEAAPIGIVEVSLEGDIRWWNRTCHGLVRVARAPTATRRGVAIPPTLTSP